MESSISQPPRYTVKRSKDRDTEVSQTGSVFLPLAKWITAILLGMAVLLCVVVSKISLLVIGQNYKNILKAENETSADAVPQRVQAAGKEAIFIMLVTVLLVPQGVSLLWAAWTSLFRRSHPWPTNTAIGWVSLAQQITRPVVWLRKNYYQTHRELKHQ